MLLPLETLILITLTHSQFKDPEKAFQLWRTYSGV